MKSKLVLWGNDANDVKILVALQLRPEDNKVDVWTFPVTSVTDEFSRNMLHEWRDGAEVAFPEGFTHTQRDLAAADSLLPDDIKVDKIDLVERAQTEWHFLVLSHKLDMQYHSELNDMKERIAKLEAYDQNIWDELKTFWDKVREQVTSRNLMREQADSLRDNINDQFTALKNLRSMVDDEFKQASQNNFEAFSKRLGELETRIREQINTSDIFEELKRLQGEFKEVQVARELRFQIWDRIDGAFKAVKEKRFGSNYNSTFAGGTFAERIQRRFDGLMSAINKMEESISRDREELEQQVKKIASGALGQLETQILEAKTKMIQTRVISKEEKLAEMNQTKAELDGQKARAAARERYEDNKTSAAEPAVAATPIQEVLQAAVVTPEVQAEAPAAVVEAVAPQVTEAVAQVVEAPVAVAPQVVTEAVAQVVEAPVAVIEKAAPIVEAVVITAPVAEKIAVESIAAYQSPVTRGSHPDDADAADLAF